MNETEVFDERLGLSGIEREYWMTWSGQALPQLALYVDRSSGSELFMGILYSKYERLRKGYDNCALTCHFLIIIILTHNHNWTRCIVPFK